MQVTPVDWNLVRTSLQAAGDRLAGLLRSVPDAGAPGTGDWTAAETATHLSHGCVADLAAIRGLGETLPPELSSPVTAIGNIGDFNAANLRADDERDLAQLATRIETTVGTILAETADGAGDEPVTWVGGSKLPISAVICHWIGEVLVHGLDIARGSGLPWTIEPTWAGIGFMGFLVPIIDALDPTAFVRPEKADLRLVTDIHVRGAGRVLFVIEDGGLRVESPGSRKADCHVSTDPATNFLLAWGRISPLRAAARGRLIAWGRRPWAATQMGRALKLP